MRASSVRATFHVRLKNFAQSSLPDGASTTRVRERPAAPAAHRDYKNHAEGLAHPSNRLVAQFNANWRVVDGPLQWILQRRKGNPRAGNPGWRDR
jgi:hypothetical protein